MGFARLAEDIIRSWKGKKSGEPLTALDKILSSTIGEQKTQRSLILMQPPSAGGTLATWNQPIEVVRVEVCATNGFWCGFPDEM